MNFPHLTPVESATAMYIGMQIYNALVQSLPNPDSLPNPNSTGGIVYRTFYNFLSIIGNDFKSFYASKSGSSIQSSGTTQLAQQTSSSTK